MPVFTEYSAASRDLLVLPSFAAPLPRLTPPFNPEGDYEKYEEIILGVGSTNHIGGDPQTYPNNYLPTIRRPVLQGSC